VLGIKVEPVMQAGHHLTFHRDKPETEKLSISPPLLCQDYIPACYVASAPSGQRIGERGGAQHAGDGEFRHPRR
jgi:hypothetical protein